MSCRTAHRCRPPIGPKPRALRNELSTRVIHTASHDSKRGSWPSPLGLRRGVPAGVLPSVLAGVGEGWVAAEGSAGTRFCVPACIADIGWLVGHQGVWVCVFRASLWDVGVGFRACRWALLRCRVCDAVRVWAYACGCGII